jgi:hypothetical protein
MSWSVSRITEDAVNAPLVQALDELICYQFGHYRPLIYSRTIANISLHDMLRNAPRTARRIAIIRFYRDTIRYDDRRQE